MELKKNILCLDIGRKTIGLSISRSGILVTPLETIRFDRDNFSDALNKLLKVFENEFVNHIVIGYPTFPSGDDCEMTPFVREFKENLEEALKSKLHKKISIVFENEQNTTLEASKILHDNNMNSKKQKNIIDSVASMVILERYLRKLGQIK